MAAQGSGAEIAASARAPWEGDVRAARELQARLAGAVVLKDRFTDPPRTIAGFDVGFEDGGAMTRAAAVLLDADTLEEIAAVVARRPTCIPYIPGLLGFRGLPALLDALDRLPAMPDLCFVDGHGIAHPRRLGIAAHFGLATGLPSIGVAKKILVGTVRNALHDTRGAFVPLRDDGTQVGWLLRSKPGCNPLVVSPGHRVSMPSAPQLAMRWCGRHRLPEPTRLAGRLASRR